MARPSQFAQALNGKEPFLPPGLARRAQMARAALWLERAAPRLGAAAAAAGLFVALALLGVWAMAPGLVRWLCLVALVAFVCWTGWRLWREAQWPSLRQGLALVEARSSLPRGQLALLHDRPALAEGEGPEGAKGADAFADQAWSRGQWHAAAVARRARLPLPRLDLVSADRWGLGALVVLGLILGLLVAGKETRWRVSDAFSPYITSLAGVTVEIAVTPPPYTGRPVAFHTVAGDGRIAFPAHAGSTLRLVARGTDRAFTLSPPEGERLHFQQVADGQSVSTKVAAGGLWRIRQGLRTVAVLDITLVADQAPRVALIGDPALTATQSLRFAYRIADDFGPTRWFFEASRQDETRAFAPASPPQLGEGVVYMDFTPDPWAGETVRLRLVAIDAAGNRGASEPLALRLPERQFNHPFAKRIIAIRKELLARPSARALAAKKLTEAAGDIGAYDGNFSVFTGLRSAFWRLRYDREDPRGWSVARLLWDVAVAVEEGERGRQLQDLRRSLDELAARMGQASEAEMEQLSEQLVQALAAYLSQMMTDAPAMPPPSGEMGDMSGAQVIDAATLGDLLSDLRERMAAGDEAGARRALETLRSLVENLSAPGEMAGGNASALDQAQSRALSGLRDLEARQREVLGETIGAGLSNALGGGGEALRRLGLAQSGLAGQAGELAGQLEDAGLNAPQTLQEAQAAMANAAAALSNGRVDAALQAQSRAMDALAEAQAALQAQRQASGQSAGGQSAAGGRRGNSLDPLGRFSGGGLGPEFRLPDAGQRRMVDAIRNELEEKAADPNRSAAERDYYLRLLRQF